MTSLRLHRLAIPLIVALALGGCGAMNAQNPNSALKPVNAIPDATTASLMLKGADVVAYFTQGRYVQGQAELRSVHEGVTFQFSNAANKALFDAAPQKYQPQYGGFCANGIVYGIPWGGDADSFILQGGKLYIFGGAGSKAAYLLDVPGNTKLADKYWSEEVKASNSFIQRSWRLTFRVPHYKNGEELARMVAAAKSK
jgi:YHS domain-containing protein